MSDVTFELGAGCFWYGHHRDELDYYRGHVCRFTGVATMDIRAFKPQDIKHILTLANRYASFDSEVSEADFQPAWSFTRGLLIAEDGGRVIGFVFAYLREVPGEVLRRWDASKVAQIELLVVDPSFRSQGIGKDLLDRLLEILKEENVDYVLLHCPAKAIEAKRLYDKMGFEVRAYAMKKHL